MSEIDTEILAVIDRFGNYGEDEKLRVARLVKAAFPVAGAGAAWLTTYHTRFGATPAEYATQSRGHFLSLTGYLRKLPGVTP
jgi:hypothetical protein